MTHKGRTVALVGGGRWGRVHASNLAALLTSRDRVLWVSRHNQHVLREFVTQFSQSGPAFELMVDLERARQERLCSAFVVTAPDTHFLVASSLLRQGVHTFVEKPLAFKVNEAQSLIDIAAKTGVVLAVGVHLLSASYLRHFKGQLSGRMIARISIDWFDPAHEVRYGEIKQTNNATPLAHDVYPHIWSLVNVMTGCARQTVVTVSKQTADSISFKLLADSVVVYVRCGRRAPMRERKINLNLKDGGEASLDFAQEPGIGMLDKLILSPDPLWGKGPRPAMAEAEDFLRQISATVRDQKWPHLAVNCLDSVAGAQALFSGTETPGSVS